MAFMVHHIKVEDFDTWKQLFDSDPVGRKQSAKGHVMLRSVDDPNEAFTRVEFGSVEDAKAFRNRLVASGALSDAATVLTPPTVVELVENISYWLATHPVGSSPSFAGCRLPSVSDASVTGSPERGLTRLAERVIVASVT